MADFNRSVFVEEHHRHGFPDDIASSHHNAFFARGRNSVAVQKFHNSCGGAGQKAVITAHYMSDVFRMEGINVFFRRNAGKGFFAVKTFRKRHLEKDSVDINSCGIGIEDIFQHLLGDILRKGHNFACNADFLAGFCLVADINLRSRVFTNKNNRKGGSSFCFGDHFFDFFPEFRADFRRNFLSVNYRCHLRFPPFLPFLRKFFRSRFYNPIFRRKQAFPFRFRQKLQAIPDAIRI